MTYQKIYISKYTVVYLKNILERIMALEFTLYQHLSCLTEFTLNLCLTWHWIPQDKILVWEGGQIEEKLLHVNNLLHMNVATYSKNKRHMAAYQFHCLRHIQATCKHSVLYIWQNNPSYSFFLSNNMSYSYQKF